MTRRGFEEYADGVVLLAIEGQAGRERDGLEAVEDGVLLVLCTGLFLEHMLNSSVLKQRKLEDAFIATPMELVMEAYSTS